MRYLIMCIGNREGGDDAIGPYVADKLKNNVTVIDCGTTPENYTSVVKKHNPEKLIIIDAIEMGLKPGEIRIVPTEKIGVMTISTHGIPLSVLINYIQQYVKEIVLIGIQPKNMSGDITNAVVKSGDRLVDLIKNNNTKEIDFLK